MTLFIADSARTKDLPSKDAGEDVTNIKLNSGDDIKNFIDHMM